MPFYDLNTRRRPADKFFAVLIANVTVWMLAYFLIRGAKPASGAPGHYVASIGDTGIFWTLLPAVVLSSAFAIGHAFIDMGLGTNGRVYRAWTELFLTADPNGVDDIRARALLTAVTLLTYWSLMILTLATGGAVRSPFGQLSLGLILLAPLIMTTPTARILNLTFGIGYVIVLHAWPRLLLWIPAVHRANAAPSLSRGSNFAWVAGTVGFASLALPELATIFGRRTEAKVEQDPSAASDAAETA